MPCAHDVTERDTAATADGLCPICLAAENERLRDFVTWVDTWVSNPVTSYSVYALDGLFGMTRDRIAAVMGRADQS